MRGVWVLWACSAVGVVHGAALLLCAAVWHPPAPSCCGAIPLLVAASGGVAAAADGIRAAGAAALACVAAAALLWRAAAWRRARRLLRLRQVERERRILLERGHLLEAAMARSAGPSPSASSSSVDWLDVYRQLVVAGEGRAQQMASDMRIADALRRVYDNVSTDADRATVKEEVDRVVEAARRACPFLRADYGEDSHSLSAALDHVADWALQKLPEIPQLEYSDIVMAKCVYDIRRLKDSVRKVFVALSQLEPIHPISRDTAIDKCRQRAAVAEEKLLPLLAQNGYEISEALLDSHESLSSLQSITGIEVVYVGDKKFVTFEGNGRVYALKQAFDAELSMRIRVEVRHYQFYSRSTYRQVVHAVNLTRLHKGMIETLPGEP